MLENLDLTYDLSLLSHQQKQMQDKTNMLTSKAMKLGLQNKVMKANTPNDNPIKLELEPFQNQTGN